MDYFNVFTASCVFTIVTFVVIVVYENYNYNEECEKLLNYKKNRNK